MANKYSGTKTEENLRTAFSGESQARNKYTYFASKAKKDVCICKDVCVNTVSIIILIFLTCNYNTCVYIIVDVVPKFR